ncbi:MAG: hypothetical protein M9942_00240 [Microthrixaceae bacterium]|nr:hypothetical protein [Microthrixaceae bacterium]
MRSLPTGDGSRNRPGRRRTTAGVLAVVAMLAGLLAVGAQPSAAATTTKKINATCSGADAATSNTLSALGGSLSTPITVTADAPAFVEPEQTGVPISMSINISLDAGTVNTVAAISPSMKVSNVRAPLAVSGPTSTTSIDATLPDQTIKLTAGQPFNANFSGIKGELNDIGTGGLIKVSTSQLTFTIQLTSGPLTDPLNLKCSTGATVLSIPVKVAGSPDIVQPIEVATQPGEQVSLDVLSEYVTNGMTKDGVEQQVDPSTLKVLEGDAQIVDGQLVATGPAAGETTDVTFEVCAGTIKIADADPGTTEVQEIRLFLDPNAQALKREMGSRFAFAGESADKVVWSMDFPFPFTEPNPPKDEEVPEGKDSWWQKNVNNFILNPHTWPTAAEMEAGLESIPTIGAGNVEVTRGDIVSNANGNVPEGVTLKGGMQYRPYVVTFAGELANKAHDQITVAQLYSFLPTEIKAQLLSLADSLGGDDEGDGEGDGEPGEEPTPIPDGLTAKQYVDQLSAEAGRLGAAGDIAGWLETIQLMFKVIGENVGDLIDISEVTALLNDVFQPNPEIVTLTQGEDPTPEQFQDLCSQGIVTLTSAEVASATATPGTEGTGGATVAGATLQPAG